MLRKKQVAINSLITKIKDMDLNNEEEMTQKEIAQEIGISRSYVSRIEKRAITKMLKEFIRDKKFN